MKCPRCGFVSFPGVRQCKKCGSSLYSSSARTPDPSPDADRLEEPDLAETSQFTSGSAGASELQGPKLESPPKLENASSPEKVRTGRSPGAPAQPEPENAPNAESASASEISERVARFRRHRNAAQELSLPFNWDPISKKESSALYGSLGAGGESEKQHVDVAFGERTRQDQKGSLDSLPLAGAGAPDWAAARADLSIAPLPKPRIAPIEFLESTFSETNPIPASSFVEIIAAPLGRRFVAGVLDGLVLLGAASVFGILFRLVGGQIQSGPLGLAVLLLITAFWVFTYFAAFSAITLATPGQAMMGLSVRNLDGELPTRQECLLRAFGYLVSIASIMLGFLWAAMDSDGLAWHDHISGTFLAGRDSA